MSDSASPLFAPLASQAALDLAGLGTWLLDLTTRTVVLSEAAGHLYRQPAFTSLSVSEWRRGVAADDHARVLDAFEHPDPHQTQQHRFQIDGDAGRVLQERWRVVRFDDGRPLELLGVVSDVSHEVSHERRRRELIHELQHRMKNMLAVVRSIARRTAAHSLSVEDFSAHFEGRLAALANVQATLARTQDGQADLEDIVRQELVHSVGSDEDIDVSGPAVSLRGRMVELIALALHELAANAVKFGTLSNGGRLAVTWEERPATSDHGPTLILLWSETGRAAADERGRTGFGLELIQRGLPYELDARVAVDFSAGLRCKIEVPLAKAGG